jgi:phosphatidylglycerophosphatase C
LVSASLRPYLEPLGAELAVDGVLCTDAETAHGRYTDRLDGPNCRAGEKAVRLHAWLEANGLTGARLWAYGDSRGDREMLAMADRPVWVEAATVPVVPPEEQL